jgi:hypothetical protein
MVDCAIPFENMAVWLENDAVDNWTLTSSSATVTGYSVDRLKNTERKRTWRSTGSGSTWIEGNFTGTTSHIDSLVIVNHNAQPIAQNWTLEIWNQFGGVPAGFPLLFNPNPAINLFSQPEIDLIRPYRNCFIHFPDIDYQGNAAARWRLTMTNPSDPYFEIGRIVLAPAFRPKDNFYIQSAVLGNIDRTRVDTTYGGDITSDNRPKKRSLTLSPPAEILHKEDIPNWLRLAQVVGKREPIPVDPYVWTGTLPFNVADELEGVQNLLWQMYGQNVSEMKLAPHSKNTVSVIGGLSIEEQS